MPVASSRCALREVPVSPQVRAAPAAPSHPPPSPAPESSPRPARSELSERLRAGALVAAPILSGLLIAVFALLVRASTQRESAGARLVEQTHLVIEAAQGVLAARTGIFAEPASASVVAALKKLRGMRRLGRKDQIVLLITGHGLKDVDAAMRDVQLPKAVQPTLAAVEAALRGRKRRK